MLRQAGVIRTENLHQLFDVAQVVLHQPLPAGDRVAVVGNSPALSALAADACASWGLPWWGSRSRCARRPTAEEFDAALAQVYARDDVDAVVASFIPPLQAATDDIQLALQRRADGSGRTTVACFIGPRLVGSTTEDRPPVPGLPAARGRRARAGLGGPVRGLAPPGDRPARGPRGAGRPRARALVEQVARRAPRTAGA